MIDTPLLPGDNSKNERYDSTVNKEHDPTIFVIYHDYMAYADYIIKFKNKQNDVCSDIV